MQTVVNGRRHVLWDVDAFAAARGKGELALESRRERIATENGVREQL